MSLGSGPVHGSPVGGLVALDGGVAVLGVVNGLPWNLALFTLASKVSQDIGFTGGWTGVGAASTSNGKVSA